MKTPAAASHSGLTLTRWIAIKLLDLCRPSHPIALQGAKQRFVLPCVVR